MKVKATGPLTSSPKFLGRMNDDEGNETVDEWECTDTCAVRVLAEQSGELKTTYITKGHTNNRMGELLGSMGHPGDQGYNDTGTAARFFYQGKATAADRQAYLTCSPGCRYHNTVMPVPLLGEARDVCPVCGQDREVYQHPTVKPYELALYHAKLLSLPAHTQPIALVPFCGTGVEARALLDVGFRVIAVDIDPRHVAMTQYRLSGEQPVCEPVQGRVAPDATPSPQYTSLDDLLGL